MYRSHFFVFTLVRSIRKNRSPSLSRLASDAEEDYQSRIYNDNYHIFGDIISVPFQSVSLNTNSDCPSQLTEITAERVRQPR